MNCVIRGVKNFEKIKLKIEIYKRVYNEYKKYISLIHNLKNKNQIQIHLQIILKY